MRHSILSGRKDTICLDNDLSINSAPLFKINKDVFEQGEQKNKTQGNKGNKGNKWNSGPRGTRGTVEYGNWGTRRTRQQLIFIFSFCVANFHPGGKSIKSCVSKYPALQNLDVMTPSSETQGQIVGARESLNRGKNMAQKKSKERPEEPLGTMPYQTSSKRSPPFWLLIGARKLVFFWHQSEARTLPLSAPGSPRMLQKMSRIGSLWTIFAGKSCRIS